MPLKHDLTSKLVEDWLNSLNHSAPINLTFVTEPLSKAVTGRVRSLEEIYHTFTVYRFLSRKGVYPLLLFTATSSSIGYSLFRAYTKSTKFVLSLVGVLYPAYRSWKLIKDIPSDRSDDKLERWLTYWLIYGSFQVFDHWVASDYFTSSRRKYNFYKLLILYWAQSPHSDGASLIYRHVIQKPQNRQRREEENKKKEVEECTTTNGSEASVMPYRYLDEFQSPTVDHHEDTFHCSKDNHSSSSSSSDDDSIGSTHQHDSNLTTSEKSSFPPLLMSVSTEAAW